MTRLHWGGNQRAQAEADAAYNRLRARNPTRKDRKATRKALKKKGFCQPKAWLRDNGTVNYHQYIASKDWQRRRTGFFKRNGRICNICGSKRNIDLHHKTYRNLGREPDSDLQALCRGCHENHHEGKNNIVADPMTREFLEVVRG